MRSRSWATFASSDSKTIPYHGSADYELAFASDPHLFFMFALTESENRMPVDAWLAPSQILRLDDRFIERDIKRDEVLGIVSRREPAWAGWRL